jgi:predicted enzyme related to lactoylglutathione lyase
MSKQGRFVWYELMTTDPAGARDFYAQVVGWTTSEGKLPGAPYWLFDVADGHVAGLLELPAYALARSARPRWTGYVAVDDVDVSVARAKDLGGKVLRPPVDLPGIGRVAKFMDPEGAALNVFAPSRSSEESLHDPKALGRVCWHELYARDGIEAFEFYAELFGWARKESFDLGPMGVYQTFGLGDEVLGGIMNKPPEAPVPHWNYYLHVGDIHAAAERVRAAGGSIMVEPHEVPGGALITFGVDPQRAIFALLGSR